MMDNTLDLQPNALLPAFPGSLSRTGLAIRGDMPFGCWEEIVHRLMLMSECSSWWLGDALLYGERAYGEMYTQAIDATGKAPQTLMNIVYVCRSYPADQRRDDLSFTHHAELAGVKDTAERAEWLRRAVEEGWSVSALRNARQEHREPVQPAEPPSPALVAASELIEAVKSADPETKIEIAEALAMEIPLLGNQRIREAVSLESGEEYDDEEEDCSDPFCDSAHEMVLDCGVPGCLMPGYHYRSECHTVEDIEAQEQPFRVYLAARYSRRQELCGYKVEVEAAGFTVTSRWLNGGHEFDAKDLREGFETEERARFAAEDWDDLMSAGICINFTEPPNSKASRGGRHVEFGGALAAGKRCIVVGHRENVFHCLPNVEFYETWEECLRAIAAEPDTLTESAESVQG